MGLWSVSDFFPSRVVKKLLEPDTTKMTRVCDDGFLVTTQGKWSLLVCF